MAINTPKLNLLKKNPVTEGTDTFNIKTMLNDNWDKIDQFAVALEDQLKVEGTENIATAVAALIREVGSLPSLTTETKTSLVAAINEVSKKLTEHSEVGASTSKAGHVQLDDSTDSTSTTKAATANAVNTVKKLISNVANYAIATAAEAKAGLVNNKYMKPLRVKEAIGSQILGPDGFLLESLFPTNTSKALYGQYVGDGQTDRYIPLGFSPKMMIIIRRDSYYGIISYSFVNDLGYIMTYAGGQVTHTSGKGQRIVGSSLLGGMNNNNSLNASGAVYEYMAFV